MRPQPTRKSARLLIFLGLLLGPGFFASPAYSVAPANDNFLSARNFLVNQTTVAAIYVSTAEANTTEATLEGGEPSGCRTVSMSVWYKFISTAAFKVNAETVGSSYDTVLTIYKA